MLVQNINHKPGKGEEKRRKGRAMQKYEHLANNHCERVRNTTTMYEGQPRISR